MKVNGMVPTRFLVLTAQLVLTVSILIDREPYVGSSPASVDNTITKDQEFIIATSLGLIFLVIELILFFCGMTMFNQLHSLFSICLHFAGTILTSYQVIRMWPVSNYWITFAVTIALPFVVELVVSIIRLSCRNSL